MDVFCTVFHNVVLCLVTFLRETTKMIVKTQSTILRLNTKKGDSGREKGSRMVGTPVVLYVVIGQKV